MDGLKTTLIKRKLGGTILISDREKFSTRKTIWGQESHSKMINGSTHQEHITILNAYAPASRASKYMRQNLMELQREIDNPLLWLQTSTPRFQ